MSNREQDTQPLPQPVTVEVIEWGADDPNPGPVPLWVDAVILTGLAGAVAVFVVWPMLWLMSGGPG